MKVLLLSAYDADSHQSWRKGLVSAFIDWEWTILTLPPRYFSWRIRGNSLTWAMEQRSLLEQPYDLLIATSMTDLSALRGFVPSLAALPTIVYFHENQFGYPNSDQAHSSVEPQVLNLYTALCADQILFNSAYNQDTFLTGVEALLKRLPDHVPKDIPQYIEQRATVLPVPLADSCYDEKRLSEPERRALWGVLPSPDGGAPEPVKLLWAARWEYDKGPALLLAILDCLHAQNIDFRLCLLGQKFRKYPAEFDQIHQRFQSQLVQFGYEESATRYQQWLASADLVLSTALHEFQGLAVLEAMAAGCCPVLPNRLAYPEWVSADFLYEVDDLSLNQQSENAVTLIRSLSEGRHKSEVPDLSWATLKPHYAEVFRSIAKTV